MIQVSKTTCSLAKGVDRHLQDDRKDPRFLIHLPRISVALTIPVLGLYPSKMARSHLHPIQTSEPVAGAAARLARLRARGEASSWEGDAFGAGVVLYFMLSKSGAPKSTSLEIAPHGTVWAMRRWGVRRLCESNLRRSWVLVM